MTRRGSHLLSHSLRYMWLKSHRGVAEVFTQHTLPQRFRHTCCSGRQRFGISHTFAIPFEVVQHPSHTYCGSRLRGRSHWQNSSARDPHSSAPYTRILCWVGIVGVATYPTTTDSLRCTLTLHWYITASCPKRIAQTYRRQSDSLC